MKLCDRCPGAGSCLLNYLGAACTNWRKQHAPDVVVTNADCIRAMSDEELAENHSTLFAGACDFNREGRGAEKCDRTEWHGRLSPCSQCALKWLQQPAETANT